MFKRSVIYGCKRIWYLTDTFNLSTFIKNASFDDILHAKRNQLYCQLKPHEINACTKHHAFRPIQMNNVYFSYYTMMYITNINSFVIDTT